MDRFKYNIIIADNQPIVIKGLRALIGEEADYTISGTVHDGRSLITFLKEEEAVNTLIIDLYLPKTNIYSLFKNLIAIFPSLKIIVFTNYNTPKLVQSMMEYGVHAYLSKSADLEEIKDAIIKVHEDIQIISPSVYQENKPAGKIKEDINIKDIFTKFTELTERETEIISLLSKGMTSKEMAEELYLSIHTVETHRKNLMRKMKLKSTAQLVHMATLQGVI